MRDIGQLGETDGRQVQLRRRADEAAVGVSVGMLPEGGSCIQGQLLAVLLEVCSSVG